MLSSLLEREIRPSSQYSTRRAPDLTTSPYRRWEKPGTDALGFSVERTEIMTRDGTAIPHNFALRRAGTDVVYGVVGDRYSLIQPSEVGELASEFARASGGAVESSYSLKNGERFGCHVALPGHLEIGTRNDKQVKCVSFDSGNDGGTTFTASATCLRLQCMNQWYALMTGGKSRGLRKGNLARVVIRHTRSGADRVRQIQGIVREMMAAFRETDAMMHALQSRKLDLKGGELRDYYTQILPDPIAPAATGNYREDREAAADHEKEAAKVKGIRRCWFNTFEEERDALATDPNLWLAYNSATKWMQHSLGIRGLAQDPERRAFSNLPGGKGHAMTEKARDVALAMIA
jgi:hypothetical protein